jgi:coenzyme PQQ precursor peptide PqqA
VPVNGRASVPQGNENGETAMTWTAPKVVEISVGMEINCYACAEL